MRHDFTFGLEASVRLLNSDARKVVTSRRLTNTGEWYRLNYGGHWYGAAELHDWNDRRDPSVVETECGCDGEPHPNCYCQKELR